MSSSRRLYRKNRQCLELTTAWGVAIIALGLTLGPLYWHFVISTKKPVDAFKTPPDLIYIPDVSKYAEIWQQGDFAAAFFNSIIVALIWKIILDPTIGPVNLVLRQLGLPVLGFLGDPAMGMASIILIDAWWQTAFVFIVFSAGLQALPREPLEAAEVDGAGF